MTLIERMAKAMLAAEHREVGYSGDIEPLWNELSKTDRARLCLYARAALEAAAPLIRAPLVAEVERLKRAYQGLEGLLKEAKAERDAIRWKFCSAPVARLQLPDGTVAGNCEESAEAWRKAYSTAEARVQRLEKVLGDILTPHGIVIDPDTFREARALLPEETTK